MPRKEHTMPDDPHHDDTDVPAALARETQDGPGDLTNLPPSDFDDDEGGED